MVISTARKWGNSVGIIIPAEEAERLGIVPGSEVHYQITPKKKIRAFGLFKNHKYTPFKRDPNDWDREGRCY